MSKIILITGTSTGFGKLTAKTLANAGYTVIAGMRDTAGNNAGVAKELAGLANIDVVDIDVASDESVRLAFQHVLTQYGHIDVLVNNAGVAGYGLLEAYSLDQIRQLFEVNFYGVLRTIQAVLPGMRERKSGLIVNLTSGASGHTLPFMIPYLASKFGVESITEGLADELSDFGIESVSIQPGVYPTEMNTGGKAGVHADKPEIIAAYGDAAAAKFNALGTAFGSKMIEFNMDPQAIADGVLELVQMERGTRPLRFPIDPIAQGTDIEFINARSEIKGRWLSKYRN